MEKEKDKASPGEILIALVAGVIILFVLFKLTDSLIELETEPLLQNKAAFAIAEKIRAGEKTDSFTCDQIRYYFENRKTFQVIENDFRWWKYKKASVAH